jgi:hypothetical protein
MDTELQDISRNKVRFAAIEITNIAQDLHSLDLTRYFPTTGVTVLLPAVIIHLLDIKSSDPNVRMTSLQRFYQCMRILQRLREIYASADFATSFLEAAIRKAGIQLTVPPQELHSRATNARDATSRASALTPPPDSLAQKIPDLTYPKADSSRATALQLDEAQAFTSTPPPSDGSDNGSTNNINPNYHRDAFAIPNIDDPELSLSQLMDLANDAEVTQNDFDALINFDDAGQDFFSSENGMENAPADITTTKGFPFTFSDMFETGEKGVDLSGLGEAQTTNGDAPQAETRKLDLDLGLSLGA